MRKDIVVIMRNIIKMALFTSILSGISLIYYTKYTDDTESFNELNSVHEIFTQYYNGTEDYLINTPGCYIPNYMKTMKIKEVKHLQKTCGERAVFIRKISNDLIEFVIDEVKMRQNSKKQQYTCCFKFAIPSIRSGKVDYTSLVYTQCKHFKNGTEEPLANEIIIVTCTVNSSKSHNIKIYEDAYAVIKKVNITNREGNEKEQSWNVLIIGMDTMSRARFYTSMPKTAAYLTKDDWLDYRGYQKVGYNTFPNVMAFMTGKNVSTVYKDCASGMDNCNKFLIWSDFRKAGYVTATGEDFLRLPDTFAHYGYKSLPTDHYLRPLFLNGEYSSGNLICTEKMPSAKHILDYATQFTRTYRSYRYFGMFWLNSYSHNLENIPTLIDNDMVSFFQGINETGVLNNTFIFFLSDHGVRYGNMKIPYESYYDERLPMLFVRVPKDFRKTNLKEYKNLNINQHRLITPYDVHLTLRELIKWKKTVQRINTEACPHCHSIFNEITPYRKCEDVYVDEKWCTCHKMFGISEKDIDTNHSIQIAVTDIQDQVKDIKTTSCMKCSGLKLKKVLRAHTYRDESHNNTYFILAFLMTPGDVSFEATIVKRNNKFNVVKPTYSTNSYNNRKNCVIQPNHREYCVCEKIVNCKIKH